MDMAVETKAAMVVKRVDGFCGHFVFLIYRVDSGYCEVSLMRSISMRG